MITIFLESRQLNLWFTISGVEIIEITILGNCDSTGSPDLELKINPATFVTGTVINAKEFVSPKS